MEEENTKTPKTDNKWTSIDTKSVDHGKHYLGVHEGYDEYLGSDGIARIGDLFIMNSKHAKKMQWHIPMNWKVSGEHST